MIIWISILYSPTFCDTLSFSAGLWRSFTPAATRHHFMSGAQKNTVFGPTSQPYAYAVKANAMQKEVAELAGITPQAACVTHQQGGL